MNDLYEWIAAIMHDVGIHPEPARDVSTEEFSLHSYYETHGMCYDELEKEQTVTE